MTAYQSDPYPLVNNEASFFYDLRNAEDDAKPTMSLHVPDIADVENLALVFDDMRRNNGKAPGPDRISYPDISRRELFGLLRPLSMAIIAGTYQPGPARDLEIPKSGNRGVRTLALRNILDRVVSKAVNEALTPFWETMFLNRSHGFRPKRSNLTLLAQLENTILSQDRWVLVSDDVRSAFPSLNIDLVLADHERHLGDNSPLLRLVEAILRGDDQNKKVGLDQGSPYMPMALNVHLHHVFDLKAHALGAHPEISTPWFRFADNVGAVCRDVVEGTQALSRMSQWLQAAGLGLKAENGGKPVDLKRGGEVQLLGSLLYRKGDQLRYKMLPEAFADLKASLQEAHKSTSPPRTAQAVMKGWFRSFGPAFHTRQNRTVSEALRLASICGFRELPGHGYFEGLCRRSWDRWKTLVSQARP